MNVPNRLFHRFDDGSEVSTRNELLRKKNEASISMSSSSQTHPSKKDCVVDVQDYETWPILKPSHFH